METTLDPGVCGFGAALLLKHLAALQAEMDGAKAALDIEHIHRLRVASRRLRSAIPLFRDILPTNKVDTWRSGLRNVTQSLGEARDTDVQIELLRDVFENLPSPGYRLGIRRLIIRLTQDRAKIQKDVIRTLGKLEKSGLIADFSQAMQQLLSVFPPTEVIPFHLYQMASYAVSERLNEFLLFDEIVDQPDRIEELHKMRIAAKKLRYTLEHFAPIYPDEAKDHMRILRTIQDTLGNIHDCDVWGQFLPKFMDKERQRVFKFYGNASQFGRLLPGMHFFEQNRKEARSTYYEQFVKDWQRWKIENVWGSLRVKLEKPLTISQVELYPPQF